MHVLNVCLIVNIHLANLSTYGCFIARRYIPSKPSEFDYSVNARVVARTATVILLRELIVCLC